jgi:drug/metabolite transporter (DMT)-like permease
VTALPRSKPAAAPALPRLGWLLLALLAVSWGFNWTALKLSLREIPIWQLRATTCLLAGLGLLLIARLGGQRIALPVPLWRMMALGALLNVTGWNVLTAYGVRAIASGEAALLAYTMPIWATILGVLLLGERLTLRVLAALLLGMAGVLLLLSGGGGFGALGQSPWGVLAMLGGALSWALGTIVQKRVAWPISIIAAAGWQLVIGAVPIVIVAAFGEPFVIFQVSDIAFAALAYNLFIGMILGYYVWFKLVSVFPASIAAIGAVAVPVMGTLSGAIFLHEPFGWPQFAALVAVVGALCLILLGNRRGAAAE